MIIIEIEERIETSAIVGDSPVFEISMMVLSIREVGRDTRNPV